jgi:hypothetical protein
MKLFASGLLALTILLATSCKKEKTANSKKIGGDYIVYEIEVYNPGELIKLPTKEGEHAKIEVQQTSDTTAIATVFLYDANDKETASDPFDCDVVKDSDGDILLVQGSDRIANIWEDYDMDFYGIENMRITGKKK